MKKPLAFCAVVAVVAFGSAAPAAAERAAESRGAGVCVSQIALTESVGDLARTLAADQAVAESLDHVRNTCGEPPGPGHLR